MSSTVSDPTLDDAIVEYMTRPEARWDPHPLYARMRRTAPVLRCDPLQTWFVTGYDEAKAVLKNVRASTSPTHAAGYEPNPAQMGRARQQLGKMILWIDPPDHTRLRALIGRTFNPRGAKHWADQLQRWSDELADSLADRDEISFLQDAGLPVPLWLTCDLLGLPRESSADLQRWTAIFLRLMEPEVSAEAEQAADRMFEEFDALLAPLIEERKAGTVRREDLLDEFVKAEEAGELSRDEMLAYSLILMVAAHETTASALTNGIYTLLRHPEAWEQIVADPSLIPGAFEEMIRFESPTRNAVSRWGTEDLEVGGTRIPAGEKIIVLLTAANRDPAVFDAPDVFDIHRSPNRHVGFSSGGHVCLGAPLARIEATEILRALSQRYPRMEIVGEPRWADGYMLRVLDELRVRLEPDATR